jgi:cell wall-associated NlpC family hydrolase
LFQSLQFIHLNGYYHYYGPSNGEEEGDDCTNYVSQILRNAEMPMLRQYEHGEDDWWTIPAPQHVPFGAAPDHTNNWSVAEVLYHRLRETGLAAPLTGSETPHAGDLVFFQWRTPGWRKSTIDHMGMIVSGNNGDPAHEIYTSHTANRLIPMTKEYDQIGEYLHGLEPKFAPSENQRGRHWEWFILRPVHLAIYVKP